MSETVNNEPGRRQRALDLTCALIAGGFITAHTPEAAAEEAVQLLNAMEVHLRMQPTPHR